MRNLEYYLKKAMEKQGLKSKRKLCEALGVSHSATDAYNRGSLPADDTMVKIAEMAGIDEETALMDLNMWRAPDAVKSSYARMLKKLTQTTACLALTAIPTSAYSANIDGTFKHYEKREYILSLYAISS